MKKFLLILLVSFIATGCETEPETLVSPCVGASGSPCDNRTPINVNHLEEYKV